MPKLMMALIGATLAACTGAPPSTLAPSEAPAVTPQIIYVTPEPTAQIIYVTPAPTPASTPTIAPPPTPDNRSAFTEIFRVVVANLDEMSATQKAGICTGFDRYGMSWMIDTFRTAFLDKGYSVSWEGDIANEMLASWVADSC